MENGDILPTSTLISNLDVTSTHSLIQSDLAARRLDTLKKRDVSCSGLTLLDDHHVYFYFPAIHHPNCLGKALDEIAVMHNGQRRAFELAQGLLEA